MDKSTYVEDEGIKFLRRRICVNIGTDLVLQQQIKWVQQNYGYGLVDAEEAATGYHTLP